MKTLHFLIVIIATMVSLVAFGTYVIAHPIFGGTAPSMTIKGYVQINTPGLEKIYRTGQPINFSVLVQGFGLYPCQPPQIAIYNNIQTKPMFYYTAQDISCTDSSEHYIYYFPSQNKTFSTIINETGTYTVKISVGQDSYQKQFSVIPSNSSRNLDVKSKITDNDTYLSQTVDEWKSKTPEQLDAYYKKYKDAFYDELGNFLIKDEMKKELERQKIKNMHDDFKVFPGMSLDSLPPHVSYDAVVNATNGNSYLLLGGVFANKVESVTIKKLVFDKDVLNSLNTGKKPSFVNPFAKAPKIVISEQSGTNPVVEPYDLALDLDKGNLVTFYNNLTVSIRIQPYGSGLVVDEGGLGWKSKMIGSHEMAVVQFNKTGYYEWDARSPPQGSENWWGSHGSGQIAAFSQNHDDSPSGDKLKMAQVFVTNSNIPWSSTGLDNYGDLEIGLLESVYRMIPDAQKYYAARAMQLIPFDVPVIISSPSFAEK